MKKQYQLREGEALHEWIDRLMESMPLRRLRELTQEQLAQEAGLQRTHVNRIEAGEQFQKAIEETKGGSHD